MTDLLGFEVGAHNGLLEGAGAFVASRPLIEIVLIRKDDFDWVLLGCNWDDQHQCFDIVAFVWVFTIFFQLVSDNFLLVFDFGFNLFGLASDVLLPHFVHFVYSSCLVPHGFS